MKVIICDAYDSAKRIDEFTLDIIPRKDDFIKVGSWRKERYLVLSVTHEIGTTDEGYFTEHVVRVHCVKAV